jgi:hypothetical protein
LYRDARSRPLFGEILKRYFVYNKPVTIGEFGCCTYKGAEDAGGMAWAIGDYSKDPVQLNAVYARDESLQARELTDALDIFESAGVEGVFVYTFVSPIFPSNEEDPLYDLDMASYSLVKSYADKHGVIYPDMTWEPKESFNAVAAYFARQEAGEGQK